MNGKGVKVKGVSTDDHLLTVWLSDGRIISAPLKWYPSLATATPQERAVWQPSGAGRSIHWLALDYDLSAEGIIAGKKEHPSALRYPREGSADAQGVGSDEETDTTYGAEPSLNR